MPNLKCLPHFNFTVIYYLQYMRIREVFKKGNYSYIRVIQFIILKKERKKNRPSQKTKQKIRLVYIYFCLELYIVPAGLQWKMRPAVGILTIVVERVIYMKIRQIWFKKIAKKGRNMPCCTWLKTFFRLIFVNPEIGFCVLLPPLRNTLTAQKNIYQTLSASVPQATMFLFFLKNLRVFEKIIVREKIKHLSDWDRYFEKYKLWFFSKAEKAM